MDLERIRDTGVLTELDQARADALCDYLVEIHRVSSSDPGLYIRRCRELVGDGECIMGLADFLSSAPFAYRVDTALWPLRTAWRKSGTGFPRTWKSCASG